jgi:hypothetical protein
MDEKIKINLLLEEYKLCFSEYAYRDQLSVTLFTATISVMMFLLATFLLIDTPIPEGKQLLIMIFGLGLLYVLHLDLMKVLSCKGAMHSRAEEIETKIKEMYPEGEFMKVVSCISGRKKYKLEFLSQNEVSVGSSMITITRFFAFIWVFSFYQSIFSLINSVSAAINS